MSQLASTNYFNTELYGGAGEGHPSTIIDAEDSIVQPDVTLMGETEIQPTEVNSNNSGNKNDPQVPMSPI